MNTFWDKIKNSNVVKVSTAYGVVCWILLQVQDAVLPTIGAPIWVAQIILFIILIGFPIAVMIAWASEINQKQTLELSQGNETQEEKKNLNKNYVYVFILSFVVIGLFAFYASPFIFDYQPKVGISGNRDADIFDYKSTRGPRYDLILGKTGTSEWGLNTEIAISPNGRFVAFTKNNDGSSEIYLRDLYDSETDASARLLAEYTWGTDVHGVLFFSDDGEWLRFFDSGILKQIRVSGGASQSILERRLGRTSGYHLFDNTLIHTATRDRLHIYDLNTKESTIIKGFEDMPRRIYRWPQILPDYENIIVSSSSTVAAINDSNIIIYNLLSGENKLLISNAFNARYVSQTGHIVFTRDSSLWSVPFDLENLEIIGNEVKIIDNIQTNGILGSSVYSFSDNGRLVYLKGIDVAVSSGDFKLDILNRDGVNIDDIPVSGRVGQLSISNDAKKLAYTAYDGSLNDIWVWDFDKNISGRRTFNGISLRPNWYKNDELIVYTNIAESRDMNGIWTAPSDGTGEPKEIFNDTTMSNLSVQSISDSQNKLFFFSGNSQFESKENTIFELDLGADPSKKIELKAFDVSPGVSEVWWARATISPDGNWLLYVSNESGLNQVYIRPYPNINAGKWQISASDASSPIWSRNSDEIFFRSGNKFYKVDYDIVETESSSFINIDEPKFLFQHTIIENHLTFPGWVHNPVEDNFVIVSNPDASETNYNSEIFSNQTTLTVVENWFNELNTLAPRFTK